MKLMGFKSNCQVLLVPNYRAFRITVIYAIIIPAHFEINRLGILSEFPRDRPAYG